MASTCLLLLMIALYTDTSSSLLKDTELARDTMHCVNSAGARPELGVDIVVTFLHTVGYSGSTARLAAAVRNTLIF